MSSRTLSVRAQCRAGRGNLHGLLLAGVSYAVLFCMDPSALVQAQTPIAVSDFEAGQDGWWASGDPQCVLPEYWSTGGNPGGRIRIVDQQEGVAMKFVAPPKFLGDQCSAYGGTLTFDVNLEIQSDQGSISEVQLIGDGMRLTYDTGSNPERGVWTSFSISMVETDGWMTVPCGGGSRPTTRDEFLRVLQSLSAIQIQGEYSGSADRISLDNVTLMPGPCNGATSVLSALCKEGSMEVVAKLSRAVPLADYELCVDGDTCATVTTNQRGRVKVAFSGLLPGPHEVSVPECGLSAAAECQ